MKQVVLRVFINLRLLTLLRVRKGVVMFGFIKRWWRRRNRVYRCDDCGKIIKKSKNRADVRIEVVSPGKESPDLTKNLNRVPGLRLNPGMGRIVLSCPECTKKRKFDQIARVLFERKSAMKENFEEMYGGVA